MHACVRMQNKRGSPDAGKERRGGHRRPLAIRARPGTAPGTPSPSRTRPHELPNCNAHSHNTHAKTHTYVKWHERATAHAQPRRTHQRWHAKAVRTPLLSTPFHSTSLHCSNRSLTRPNTVPANAQGPPLHVPHQGNGGDPPGPGFSSVPKHSCPFTPPCVAQRPQAVCSSFFVLFRVGKCGVGWVGVVRWESWMDGWMDGWMGGRMD